MSRTKLTSSTIPAIDYARQAEKLSLETQEQSLDQNDVGTAVQAKFITPLDPVVETADGNRLPAIPVKEAHKLNILKAKAERSSNDGEQDAAVAAAELDDNDGRSTSQIPSQVIEASTDKELESAIPPSRTHPLFPPLPLWGPPSLLRSLQCAIFRFTSFLLSTSFLGVIVLGSVFTAIPILLGYVWMWLTFRNPDKKRPFHEEEQRRQNQRKAEERKWLQRKNPAKRGKRESKGTDTTQHAGTYQPFEGGPDKLLCDIRYYARRVGLDAEVSKVQTEDGFVIELWHILDPTEQHPAPNSRRRASGPEVSTDTPNGRISAKEQNRDTKKRYPVLLVHGLLQSAGAFCCNDDDSLAFFLCKSGFDVWLGNNRCGFQPEHTLLKPNDPRMWCWNIRQTGVMDLPAFVSRVLDETGFEKLSLVCHSQGTTEAFVALAKEQRPDLGSKISVFCALAPAVYSGPLIEKMYFKFMRLISPAMFRLFFGIHSFIPLMMLMHRILPGRVYGFMGYRVFSFLFNWSDTRWDRGLRDRLFRFSPVYVSAESMRWWLGRECFAKHKCVLATKQEWRREEAEDEEEDERREEAISREVDKGKSAWYGPQVPPMALWIAGSDQLVDGQRLLRRFERGREPYVNLIYSKVIDEYEHLDVVWAMDAIDKIGKEVRQVLADTIPAETRGVCRPLEGTEDGRSRS